MPLKASRAVETADFSFKSTRVAKRFVLRVLLLSAKGSGRCKSATRSEIIDIACSRRACVVTSAKTVTMPAIKHGLHAIWTLCYILGLAWEVEFTDEFEEWWHSLSESEQGKVDARVGLLIEHGPNLGFPFSSQVKTSRFPEMRELRVQAGGDPLRMLYAFDPRRVALLLLAGDKTGDGRWYETKVPVADRLFEHHLNSISKEPRNG